MIENVPAALLTLAIEPRTKADRERLCTGLQTLMADDPALRVSTDHQTGHVIIHGMVWARVTFGRRSFHAAANPTSGGLVQTGPYAYIRHPIYAAATYFVWAGAIDHHTAPAVAGAALLTVGAFGRMLAEEHLLVGMYPAYAAYRERTRRIVPFVF